jgi:[lysine-biosynthesis-protein LysW]--L-2-aminoadipate ligase
VGSIVVLKFVLSPINDPLRIFLIYTSKGGFKLKIGLIYDRISWNEKQLFKAATKKKIDLNLIDAKRLSLTASDCNSDLQEYDVILQRSVSFFRGLYLSAILEAKNLKVINSFQTAQTCGNKLLTTLALTKANIPTPKTLVSFTEESALESLDVVGYPAVIKPLVGSWGRLVSLVNNQIVATSVLEHKEMLGPLHKIHYIQEKVPSKRDIRAFVIGDQVVAAMYRKANGGDWRTNIARGGTAKICEITQEIRDLSLKAAEVVGGGILGVDLLEDKEGLVVNEINHTVEFRGLMETTFVKIPELIIEFVIEHAKN